MKLRTVTFAGLGLAAAKKFIEQGIRTIIIGRNEQKLAEVANQLGELCSYKSFDLSKTAGIPAFKNGTWSSSILVLVLSSM